ncbi:MAG: tRNA modification GTPase MnmE [Chlamydiae bacterium]|nr:tRNA modification GTPase MnmE [Chlamydiota bacterium]
MLFINDSESTIVALATPPGEGGIAIIRLSGNEAEAIANQIFSGDVTSYPTHTAHLGKVVSESGAVIDEALLLIMRAPRSFTGEDTVEVQCHGGSLIARKILNRCIGAGARMAQPGEFSYRAFMNGKLDLAQAEAVQHLIGAKNEHALSAASHQLSGALSSKIRAIQSALVDTAAILEAWVDFPEEGLEFASFEEVIQALENAKEMITTLAATFHEGRKLHEGLTLCLAGLPNVGKSSLMNGLLGHERAIVTEIAGTTRDLLQEELSLVGLHFRLIDTAGLRNTEEIIEKEGIRRSRAAMEEADLILLVIDASKALTEEEELLLASAPTSKTLVVWNKIDLPHKIPPCSLTHQVALSAKTGRGLDALRNALEAMVWKEGPPSKEEVVLTEQRHKAAIDDALASLNRLIEGLKEGVSAEFVAADMRATLNALGTIIGSDITDDILSAIFSKFCVGK